MRGGGRIVSSGPSDSQRVLLAPILFQILDLLGQSPQEHRHKMHQTAPKVSVLKAESHHKELVNERGESEVLKLAAHANTLVQANGHG